MKTREDLLTEISLASRITREPRLLALLGDIKAFLESTPPAHQEKPPLEPREGRLPPREIQIRKAKYMREFMRKRRAKQKEAKLAIINSTTSNPDRDRDQARDEGPWDNPEPTSKRWDKAPWEED